jgi:hypothetical protein
MIATQLKVDFFVTLLVAHVVGKLIFGGLELLVGLVRKVLHDLLKNKEGGHVDEIFDQYCIFLAP